MIAALQGDLDTSDGVGKVFFRQDSSPDVLSRAAQYIHGAFPEDGKVDPTNAVVVTWVNVGAHEPPRRGDDADQKVSVAWSIPAICCCNFSFTYALMLRSHRETLSNWSSCPSTLHRSLLSCTQGTACSFHPLPYKPALRSCTLASVRVWSRVFCFQVRDHTTAPPLMTRHPSGLWQSESTKSRRRSNHFLPLCCILDYALRTLPV